MPKINPFDENMKEDLYDISEIMAICANHIKETGKKYDDVDALQIIKWIETTRLNNILLGMVLDGKIDITFDGNVANEEIPEQDGLYFRVTKAGIDELSLLYGDDVSLIQANPIVDFDNDSELEYDFEDLVLGENDDTLDISNILTNIKFDDHREN